MAGNGKVYISASHGDNPEVAKLLAAFKSKRADAWRGPEAAGALAPEAQRQLAERDTLIRVLNARSASGSNMRLELAEYQRLRAADAQGADPKRRAIINLITDATYQRQPEDAAADITIITVNKPDVAWLPMVFKESGQLKARAELPDRWLLWIAGGVMALILVAFLGMLFYAISHHLVYVY